MDDSAFALRCEVFVSAYETFFFVPCPIIYLAAASGGKDVVCVARVCYDSFVSLFWLFVCGGTVRSNVSNSFLDMFRLVIVYRV